MVTSTYNKFNTAVEWFANGGFRASTLGDVFLFLLTNSAPTPTAADSAAPAAAPAKPVEPGVKGYSLNVSASGFHAAVLNNDEVPHLKKRQPSLHAVRNVSPMSEPTLDPRSRRDYAPAGSALDEPNPSRKG